LAVDGGDSPTVPRANKKASLLSGLPGHPNLSGARTHIESRITTERL
jgi:hypothetical protein